MTSGVSMSWATVSDGAAKNENAARSTQTDAPDVSGTKYEIIERVDSVTMDDVRDYNILRDPELEKHGVMDIVRRAFAGEAGVVPPIPYRPYRGKYQGQGRWCGSTIYPVKDEHGAVRTASVLRWRGDDDAYVPALSAHGTAAIWCSSS